MVVLDPVLVGHIAGVAGRVVVVGRETEDLEALAGHLGTGISLAVRGCGHPLVAGEVRIVASDADLAAVGHLLLVPLYLNGGNHRLAGVAEAAGRTVIEDIPLAVDLLQGAVGVVGGVGGDQVLAVFVRDDAARVH